MLGFKNLFGIAFKEAQQPEQAISSQPGIITPLSNEQQLQALGQLHLNNLSGGLRGTSGTRMFHPSFVIGTGSSFRFTDKYVIVKNSTPEPDGTYKNYMLRVPSHIKTAKEAIAWTFGMKEEEYEPEKET